MTTQAAIEQSIRRNLPILFGNREPADDDAFLKRFDSLAEYAATVSEPFLRSETTRYQSILLYVSLVFVSIGLFGIGQITFGETLLFVDRRLLFVYTVFIAAVAVIFLMKAYVDYQRANFSRSKNFRAITEMREVLDVSSLRKNVQYYFWEEISNTIGRAYEPFHDAMSKSLDQAPDVVPTSTNLFTMDLKELRKIPELTATIEANEKCLAELSDELAKDVAKFEEKAEIILKAREAAGHDDPYRVFSDSSFERINKAFDECLGSWFDLRNRLQDENLSVIFGEATNSSQQKRAKAVLRLLERIQRIRRLYVGLEVFAPVLFAAVAIFYVWSQ